MQSGVQMVEEVVAKIATIQGAVNETVEKMTAIKTLSTSRRERRIRCRRQQKRWPSNHKTPTPMSRVPARLLHGCESYRLNCRVSLAASKFDPELDSSVSRYVDEAKLSRVMLYASVRRTAARPVPLFSVNIPRRSQSHRDVEISLSSRDRPCRSSTPRRTRRAERKRDADRMRYWGKSKRRVCGA